MPGQPTQVMAAWRSDPPAAFKTWNFKLEDESYNSLTHRARYYDWPQKVTFVASLGFALLFKDFMGSQFDLTSRFDEEGPAHTKVTIVGHAHPSTQAKLAELAEEHGGALGRRVIV
jgi:hypothetical protein